MFVVLCIVLGAGHSMGEDEKAFEAYRFNPFQFPYPEYSYKADIVAISHLNQAPKDTTSIDCFGISALFPKKYVDQVDKKSPSRLVIRSKNNQAIMINREKDQRMGCSDESEKNNKDFCSAFTSTEDFYNKLFTLTPDDLAKDTYASTGFAWIVHRKGIMFQRVSDVKIYKGKGLTIYRTDLKDPDMSIKTELIVFPESIKPDFLILSMNFKDNDLIETFISSAK